MNKIVESTLKTLPDEVSHFDFISNTEFHQCFNNYRSIKFVVMAVDWNIDW